MGVSARLKEEVKLEIGCQICPFCGGQAGVLVREHKVDDITVACDYYAECIKCGSRGEVFTAYMYGSNSHIKDSCNRSIRRATDAWNRRIYKHDY